MITLTLAGVLCAVWQPGSAQAADYSKKQLKAALAELDAGIKADPAKASETLSKEMKKYGGSGLPGELAKAAMGDLPKKNGAVDVVAEAALLKTAVDLIYAEFPKCRADVQAIVLAAVDAIRVAGQLDPRTLATLLSAVLPDILANDPGLIDQIFKALESANPAIAAALAQLEADLLTPLNSGTPERLSLEHGVLRPFFEVGTLPEVTPVHNDGQ